MNISWKIALVGLGLVASFSIGALTITPNTAQQHVLDEYLAVYCPSAEEKQKPAQHRIGEAAVLSRLTIGLGIGTLAEAERLKCSLFAGK